MYTRSVKASSAVLFWSDDGKAFLTLVPETVWLVTHPGVWHEEIKETDWTEQMLISLTDILGQISPDDFTVFIDCFIITDPSRWVHCIFSEKWRPRRSIMFCSWGGEEFGLLGSNEWSEVEQLSHSVVVLLYLFVVLSKPNIYFWVACAICLIA